MLDAYLSGHLSLEDFWTDGGPDRLSVYPLQNVVRKAIWSHVTLGQCDQVWWQRLKLLIDHATMAMVDNLEAMDSLIKGHRRDWQRFRANLRRTGGCLIWDQLSEMVGYSNWAIMKKKFENGSVLALGQFFSEAFYPIAQFDKSGAVISGVRDVHSAFGDDVVDSFNFLVENNARLEGRAPIDCLHDGEKRRVVRLARVAAIEQLSGSF